MRTITAEMGGLSEDRFKKGRGKKWREKARNREQWINIMTVAVQISDE